MSGDATSVSDEYHAEEGLAHGQHFYVVEPTAEALVFLRRYVRRVCLRWSCKVGVSASDQRRVSLLLVLIRSSRVVLSSGSSYNLV